MKARKVGMNDFLEKPLDIKKLKNVILRYGKPQKGQTIKPKEDKVKIRALVVDDNILNLKLLTAFLKKMNFEGDAAVNGEEAVEKMRGNQYDICFMDIQMPVMGGVEATKIIRKEISQDIPIIAVTAVNDFTLKKSLEAGMTDYLSKPVSLAVLKTIISKYCNKSA